MELITIFLSGLLSLFSGSGLILDYLAQSNLRSQVVSIEQQAVRVDNIPSYSIAQGKLQRIRIAARGINLRSNLRISALEIETDPLDLNLSKLETKSLESFRQSLEQPLQGAVKLIIGEADLNAALKSASVQEQLQTSLNSLVASRAGSTSLRYELIAPHLELKPNNYWQLKFKLRRPSLTDKSLSSELAFTLAVKIKILNGKKIELSDPQGTVNSRPMSSRLLNGFAQGISDRLNLASLESGGIVARLLQLEIKEEQLELVGFFRLETPESQIAFPLR